MVSKFYIKGSTIEDIPVLYAVFEASVRNTCIGDYTPEQIDAWVGRATEQRWRELFETGLSFFIAEDTLTNETAGFVSVNAEGYIHSMFVYPDFQRCGVATLLLGKAEEFALEYGAKRMCSEVSKTALPFFKSAGYKVEREQTVTVNGVEMNNFVMGKSLFI